MNAVRSIVSAAVLSTGLIAGGITASTATADEKCMTEDRIDGAENSDKVNHNQWIAASPKNEEIYKKLCAIIGTISTVEGKPVCKHDKTRGADDCNTFAVAALDALFVGVNDLKSGGKAMSANDIAKHLAKSDSGWESLGNANVQNVLARAAQKASEGFPVVAVIDRSAAGANGHIALILPGELKRSGWTNGGTNLDVPNSTAAFQGEPGKRYLFCRLSRAFSKDEAKNVVIYSRKTKPAPTP
jgi:hypothetical protein